MRLMFLFCIATLSAQHVSVFTLPKSGTHYLLQILEALTEKEIRSSYGVVFKGKEAGKIQKCHVHCETTTDFHRVANTRKAKSFLLIRDIRDVLNSAVHYADRKPLDVFIVPSLIPKYRLRRSYNDKLRFIVQRSWYREALLCIPEFYNVAAQRHNFAVIRYEDLASDDHTRRIETLAVIAQHLNLSSSYERLEEIDSTLFRKKGETLRKGCVGDYKNYFDHATYAFTSSKYSATNRLLGYK